MAIIASQEQSWVVRTELLLVETLCCSLCGDAQRHWVNAGARPVGLAGFVDWWWWKWRLSREDIEDEERVWNILDEEGCHGPRKWHMQISEAGKRHRNPVCVTEHPGETKTYWGIFCGHTWNCEHYPESSAGHWRVQAQGGCDGPKLCDVSLISQGGSGGHGANNYQA